MTLERAVKSGKNPMQTAKIYAATFAQPKFISRSDTNVPAAVLMAAFSTPRPARGGLVAGRVALADGDQAVFVLTGVKAGDITNLTKKQEVTQLRELARLNGEAEFTAYLANLRRHAEIKVYSANIQE